MNFIEWIEASALAEWVRISISGYPAMITLHSVGLAVMVGLSLAVDMRLLGRFRSIPFSSLRTFFTVAWIGFLINFVSGAALFSSQATLYVTNVPFLLKMAFVLAGAATVGYLQAAVARTGDSQGADSVATGATRFVAILSIVVWLGATITGRLIAYL
ncbi:MAG: hypothetical protein JXB36_12970 [Gammaproteobacteria bacterium]|nr:hypothetical protein [Gammaproteobacteria bacterium]